MGFVVAALYPTPPLYHKGEKLTAQRIAFNLTVIWFMTE